MKNKKCMKNIEDSEHLRIKEEHSLNYFIQLHPSVFNSITLSFWFRICIRVYDIHANAIASRLLAFGSQIFHLIFAIFFFVLIFSELVCQERERKCISFFLYFFCAQKPAFLLLFFTSLLFLFFILFLHCIPFLLFNGFFSTFILWNIIIFLCH